MKKEVIRQRRKSLSLSVEGERIVVKAPFGYPDSLIERFIEKNREWIEKKAAKEREMKRYYYLFGKRYEKGDVDEVALQKEEAKRYIIPRTYELAEKFNLTFNTVKINSAKKRWGSCSTKKNLNFSYRCVTLPKRCIDYIIIHELCHLTHMNHSKEFWELVKRRCPGYKELEQLIKAGP